MLNRSSPGVAPAPSSARAWPGLHRSAPLVALAFAVAAAAALRLSGLTREGLWLDEAISVRRASLPLTDLLGETAALDVHPPLYYVLLHVWTALFGSAEWSVRLPSVLASTATVVAAYAFGRLVFDRSTGLLAAVLVAFSVYHAHHAQDARMYAFVALLATLSMWAFVRWYAAAGRRHAPTYVVCTVLLLYTHVYGFFVLMGQQAFGLAAAALSRQPGRPAVRAWLRVNGVMALLFAPWAVAMVAQVRWVHREFWIPPPGWDGLPRTFRLYAGSEELLVVLVALAAGGYLLAWTRRGGAEGQLTESSGLSAGEQTLLLGAWLAAPVLVPFVLSFSVAAIFLPRYTIAASVAFYVIVAAGVRRLHPIGHAAALVLIVWLVVPEFERWYTRPQKEHWREAVRYVEERARPGSRVVFNADYVLNNPFAYYARRSDLSTVVLDGPMLSVLPPEQLRSHVLAGHSQVWAIVSRDNVAAQVLRERVPRALVVRERHRWAGVEVLLFEVPRR